MSDEVGIKEYLELMHKDLKGDNADMKAQICEVKDKVKIQNGRIRKLENWRWYMMGLLGSGGAGLGLYEWFK